MTILTRDTWQQCMDWLLREEHRAKARAVRDHINSAFTEHPHDTNETYWEHLWVHD